MIKLGCDPAVMRSRETPLWVFYGVLGGRKHLEGVAPKEIAEKEIMMTRRSYLYT